MKITFSRSECEYIVENPETDLMLTRIGLTLIHALENNSEEIELNVPSTDYEEFLDALREEYEWKVGRLPDPRYMLSLAERLLPNFQSLTPKKGANKAPEPTPTSVTPPANERRIE